MSDVYKQSLEENWLSGG